MKRILAIVATVMLASCTQAPDNIRILVGTYTDGNASQGVYLYSFNQRTAKYELLDTAKAGNPSFIIASDDLKHAYSVSEYEDGRQAVVSYTLTSNSIDVLNSQSTDGEASGAAPCNIVIAGGSVITSNYTGGTLTAFPILKDGSLGEMSQQFAPGVEDGLVHHMHCCVKSPDGKYLFTCDLGADRVYRFTIGDAACPLKDATVAHQFDPLVHPGPRHMVFSPDGRYACLIHELGDCVTVFAYEDGTLRCLSTGLAYTGGGNGSADVHFTPDGEYVYTSHRLKKDGIAPFKFNSEDGSLWSTGYLETGIHPRNFAISPDGAYLLCACRDSDDIETYSIKEDPAAPFLINTLDIPAPVCVQFIK